MPCVFPVLSLKALKIARYHGKARSYIRMEGLAYTFGVMLCFTLLAGLMLALKASGQVIGWGYHMQSAPFVGVLVLLLFSIGLNLSGFFELPVLFGNIEPGGVHAHSHQKSFATGLLAALVATPCSAPFMASAIGYGLTLPPIKALAIFEALGFGLAFPLLLLSFLPRLLAFMPKPGIWMEHFRQLLAFPMYISVVWLMWVLASQVGANGVAFALVAMLIIVFVIWMRRLFAPLSSAYRGIAALLIIISIIGLVVGLKQLDVQAEKEGVVSPLKSHGIPFSTEKLEALRQEGIPVFVDATATWCITCQVNYRTSLSNARVKTAFEQKHITLMVADWTRQDAEITQYLASFGHSGVPLYVYYPPHGEPKILPQVLTPEIVLEAIR